MAIKWPGAQPRTGWANQKTRRNDAGPHL